MNFFKYLCFCFTLLSCGQQKINETKSQNIFQNEDTLLKVLLKGYYTQFDNQVGISIFDNQVYILQNVENISKNENFVLKILFQEVLSNNKMNHEIFTFKDTAGLAYENLIFLYKMHLPNDYNSLYVGRSFEGDTLWSNKISSYAVSKTASMYKNEFQNVIGKNLLLESFDEALSEGVFFKNESGFYVLLVEDAIYFITDKKEKIDNTMMLHLIREDNTFNNLSFQFKDKEIDELLSSELSCLKIAKAKLPVNEQYTRIRIGQFNKNGNLWVKILDVESVFSNDLLKYNNEFKNLKGSNDK